jgi:ParB-like nuclease domain
MVELVDRKLPVDQLFLDPNNPRYADLGMTKVVPRAKVVEESVQQAALVRMLEDRFEVDQLKQSIEKVGFLRVDRLVVVTLPALDAYMVIEGNRRLAAVKSLLSEVAAGEVDLKLDIAETLKELEVLSIEGGTPQEQEEHARTLQGIRHIAGVKPWGAYQQAQAVGQMIDEGMSPSEIRSALGLTAQRFNLLRAVYFGMKQMRADPDFADLAKPDLFSHFVEALNRPAIKEWVGWDRDQGKMTNEDAKHDFYRLIVGMEDEEGERQAPKIIDAKDFRLLPKIMEDEAYFDQFLSKPSLSLQDAYRAFSPAPEPLPDWKSILRRDIATLTNSIPHSAIADAEEGDIQLLDDLRSLCERFLRDIKLVQQGE